MIKEVEANPPIMPAATNYDTILYEVSDGILTITLNRPESFNALNEAMTTDLQSALKEAERDEAVRVVVLTGAGKAFCSGQDLKDAPAPGTRRSLADSLRRRYNPIIRRMTTMPKPIIGAINGAAAGAGCSLALACDLRIAAESAYLLQAFIRIGLVPDSGSSWFLARLVGYARAFEIATLGEKITAAQALSLGLVNRVAPPESLMEQAIGLASGYAKGPTSAYGYIKKMLYRACDNALDSALDYEVFMQEAAGRTNDYNEGVASFVEKRAPLFTGK